MNNIPDKSISGDLPIIFMSFSYQDQQEKEVLANSLQKHLKINLQSWDDDLIQDGIDITDRTFQTLEQSKVAILLITANFLTSDFLVKEIIPRLLEYHSTQRLTVFPIIARSCVWQRVGWLRNFTVYPSDGQPLWRANDKYIMKHLEEIVQAIADLLGQKTSIQKSSDSPKEVDYSHITDELNKLL